MAKKTKLICTIGPSTYSRSMIRKMEKLGCDAIRINTAFGTVAQMRKAAQNVRAASGMPVIFDLKGPDVRIYTKREREFRAGDSLEVGLAASSENRFNHDVRRFLCAGDKVFLNGGIIRCKVIGKMPGRLVLRVQSGGFLKNGSSVHAPACEFSLPSLSENDRKVIRMANRLGNPVFALSYVRDASEIGVVRRLSPNAILIAKIESRSGVENIDSIAKAADAVMIGRGDLGIELQVEKLPHVQREIIAVCKKHAKAAIVATQVLESMVESPVPTRAEIADIASSINDGADCLMLSEETAIGRHPLEAIRVIAKTAEETEKYVLPEAYKTADGIGEIPAALTLSVLEIVKNTRVDRIVAPTRRGYTARILSKLRLPMPVIAAIESPETRAKLVFYYGIKPVDLGLRNGGAGDYVRRLRKLGLVKGDETLLMTMSTFMKKPLTDTIYLIDLKDSVFS